MEEISICSVDSYQAYELSDNEILGSPVFHECLFADDLSFLNLNHRSVVLASRKNHSAPSDFPSESSRSVNGKAGIAYTWGDKEDQGFQGYIKGSLSDTQGNSVDLSLEVDKDWSGKVAVEFTHEEDVPQ